MSEKSKKKNILTDEDIEKAFNELEEEANSLDSEEDFDEEEINKASDEEFEDEDSDEDEEEDSEDDEEFEDEDSEDEEDDEEDEEDDEVEKAVKDKGKKKKAKKAMDEDDDDDEYEDEDEEEKAVGDEIYKGKNEEIKKGIEVSSFLKGIVNDIQKSNDETKSTLANVTKILMSLNRRVEAIEEDVEKAIEQPRHAKSKITKRQVVEKFEKGNEDDFNDGENKVTTLGMTKNYSDIMQLLDAKAFGANADDFNPDFAKALTTFETVKQLPDNIVARIKKEDNINIVSSF